MFENIKDPYHATVLHVFLVSFGLFRADNPADAHGRHRPAQCARVERREATASADIAGLETFRRLTLDDPRLLEPVREFPGEVTVVMQTLWPNLIVQQQSNTLAVRHIVPATPSRSTCSGPSSATPTTTRR